MPKQLPGAHLRPPTLTSTPASASTSAAPRPAPPPPAPPQTHRPAGRHRNPTRPVNMVETTISTGILHLDVNSEYSNSLSTTLSKRPPLDSTTPLTKEQHHQYRQSVGQLLWLSLVRPDLQHAARDLSKHLVAPTQLDLQQLTLSSIHQGHSALPTSSATSTAPRYSSSSSTRPTHPLAHRMLQRL